MSLKGQKVKFYQIINGSNKESEGIIVDKIVNNGSTHYIIEINEKLINIDYSCLISIIK